MVLAIADVLLDALPSRSLGVDGPGDDVIVGGLVVIIAFGSTNE
jgi:hypothetical protein